MGCFHERRGRRLMLYMVMLIHVQNVNKESGMCFVLLLGASLALGSYAWVLLVPDLPVPDWVASDWPPSGSVASGLATSSQPLSLESPIPLSRSIGPWLFHPASMGVIGTSRVLGSSSSSSVAVSSILCS